MLKVNFKNFKYDSNYHIPYRSNLFWIQQVLFNMCSLTEHTHVTYKVYIFSDSGQTILKA